MKPFRAIARYFLELAERFYLATHGWERADDKVTYVPPDHWPFRRHDVYHRAHAVNATRQLYNRNYIDQRRAFERGEQYIPPELPANVIDLKKASDG